MSAEAIEGTALERLQEQMRQARFDQVLPVEVSEEGEEAAIVWGRERGEDSARIFLLCVAPEFWDRVKADYVAQQMWKSAPTDLPEDAYPKFGVVSDGAERQRVFDLEYPMHEIDQLPSIAEINQYKRIKADPTYKWSMGVYERLMNGFNSFHEQVYQTVKDRVSSKNDIIMEVAKLLFLESFRLHHEAEEVTFECEGQKRSLEEVFNAAYVRQHGTAAVAQIQAAFDWFKAHADYVVQDDAGEAHPIFDRNTHLNLAQSRNYETLLGLVQDLGPVTDNNGRTVKAQGTLADVAADCLGRAFDVFLRANFDSKGGLGIYLTPAPVKQAMVELAFHDLVAESPELLTARDAAGNPEFRFCDPACGSYGFGVVAMGRLRRALDELTGRETGSDERRERLFRDMLAHSFVGADAAPMMVTLARVNMALLGGRKARIFYTDNSLITERLQPGSFDLILTNPPFGTPKFKKNQAEARREYERNMEQILETFRSDLQERNRPDTYDYAPTVSGLALGGKPDGKGVWKGMKPTSIDPAVLFIDRCLQLLKPGGRLLIILPDGILCNSGDRYVREYIMGKKDEETGAFHGGKAIVKAVISLPSDTFKLSGTGAKTSVLYLQKRHAREEEDAEQFVDEPQGDVFMAVADTLGYEVKNNVEDYSRGVANDLAVISGAYVRGEK